MKEIELVIFDLAGTTIIEDGRVAAAFHSTLGAFGIEISPDALNEARGASKREIIRRFVEEERAEDVYQSFCKKMATAYTEHGVREIAGATDTFLWLKRNNIQIALNTGFDRILTEMILNFARWDRLLFSACVCGDDVTQGRPAPDLIFRAMELCGIVNVHRVANVGDTVLDLRAAHFAGVRYNIGVLSGAHSIEQLRREPHTHIIPSVAALSSL